MFSTHTIFISCRNTVLFFAYIKIRNFREAATCSECKSIILTYQDFLDQPFSIKINTGELLYKIRIGAYFHNKLIPNHLKLKEIKDNFEPNICDSINLDHLHEDILFGPTINFLEKLRSMKPEKFHQIISGELDNLEARIDEASGRTFNFWALADTIIKMARTSKIPQSCLDLITDRYLETYEDGKKRLGLENQI